MPTNSSAICDSTDNIVILILLVTAIVLLRSVLIWLIPDENSGKKPPPHPQSFYPPTVVFGGASTSKALIVDVANMYVGWYMEKYNRYTPPPSQDTLLEKYVDCITDHYTRFAAVNDLSTSTVTYVIKNHKTGSLKMTAPPISNKIWELLTTFVTDHPCAKIAVAEDYITYPLALWQKPSNHYLRAADDYLCFHLAQTYHKNYAEAWIMSDDHFSDFAMFGSTPRFKTTIIERTGKEGEKKNTKDNGSSNLTTQTSIIISPRPNSLGALNDYNVSKIALDFSLSDPQHATIRPPGKVW